MSHCFSFGLNRTKGCLCPPGSNCSANPQWPRGAHTCRPRVTASEASRHKSKCSVIWLINFEKFSIYSWTLVFILSCLVWGCSPKSLLDTSCLFLSPTFMAFVKCLSRGLIEPRITIRKLIKYFSFHNFYLFLKLIREI